MKKTWSTINKVLGKEKSKDSLPSFLKSNGNIISGNFEIANGFNDFFSNIGPQLADKIPTSSKHFLDFMPLPVAENFFLPTLHQKLFFKKLKSKSSSGPDHVSSKLLKDIIHVHVIAEPLAHVFNLSFKTGNIPVQLKTAKVIPVFKDGAKHCFSNYRTDPSPFYPILLYF